MERSDTHRGIDGNLLSIHPTGFTHFLMSPFSPGFKGATLQESGAGVGFEPIFEHGIDARLPAFTGCTESLDHIRIQTDIDV